MSNDYQSAYDFLAEIENLQKELSTLDRAELLPILLLLKRENIALCKQIHGDRLRVMQAIECLENFEAWLKKIHQKLFDNDTGTLEHDFHAAIHELESAHEFVESLSNEHEALHEEKQESPESELIEAPESSENIELETLEIPEPQEPEVHEHFLLFHEKESEAIAEELEKLKEKNAELKQEQLEMHNLLMEMINKEFDLYEEMVLACDTYEAEVANLEHALKKVEFIEKDLHQLKKHTKAHIDHLHEMIHPAPHVSVHPAKIEPLPSRSIENYYGFRKKSDEDEK